MPLTTFRLAWKTLSRQKVATCTAILGIAMSALIAISILTIFNSMNVTAQNANEDLYGEFTDILYHAPSPDLPQEISSQNNIEKTGVLRICGQVKASEDTFALGNADSNALALGHIKLKAGSMPQKEYEIALEASMLGHLGIAETLGKQISLELLTPDGIKKMDFTLVGVVSNYSALWVKSTNLAEESQQLPNGFVSSALVNTMAQQTGHHQQHLLLQTNKNIPFTQSIYNVQKQLVKNTFLFETEGTKTAVPYALVLLISVCSFFVVFSILQYTLAKQKKRWATLRLLGMNQLHTILCLFFTLLFYSVVALPLGILGGISFAKLMIAVIEKATHADYLYSFPWSTVLLSCLFSILPVILSGIPIAYRILHISPLENLKCGESPDKPKQATKKTIVSDKKVTLRRLAQAEHGYGSKQWVSILLITIFLIFFNFFSIYLSAFSYRYQNQEVEGKFLSDYDFQFANGDPLQSVLPKGQQQLTLGTTMPTDDSVILWNDFANLGCTETMLQDMKKTDGISSIRAYKEINTLNLRLPKEQFSDYLDACNGTLGDSMSSDNDGYRPEVLSAFSYAPSEKLVHTQLSGYSENELRSMEKYVKKGNINIDKIRSGEEVVLVLPVIQMEIKDNGTLLRYPSGDVSIDVPNLYRDTSFEPGHTLLLTQLFAKQPMKSAYLNLQDAKTHLQRMDKTVKVGAVIYQRVGWFDNAFTPNSPITLLTLNESFDAIGYPATYSRIRMDAAGGKNSSALENDVKALAQKLPNMTLQNRISEMENYRSNQFLLSFSSKVFLMFLAIVACVVLSCQNINKVLSNERHYALLRVNGLTTAHFIKMFLRDNFLLCLKSVCLALPLGAAMIGYTFWGYPDLFSLSHILQFFESILFVFLITALSIFPILKPLRKNNLADTLKNT